MTRVRNRLWLIPQPYRLYLTPYRNHPMRWRERPLRKPPIIPLSGAPLSESRLAGQLGVGVRFDSQLPLSGLLLIGRRLKRKHACESLRINSVYDFDVINTGHRKFSLGPTLRSDGHEHHVPRLALVFQRSQRKAIASRACILTSNHVFSCMIQRLGTLTTAKLLVNGIYRLMASNEATIPQGQQNIFTTTDSNSNTIAKPPPLLEALLPIYHCGYILTFHLEHDSFIIVPLPPTSHTYLPSCSTPGRTSSN